MNSTQAKKIGAMYPNLDFWYDHNIRLWSITDPLCYAGSEYIAPGWLADMTEKELHASLTFESERFAEANDVLSPTDIMAIVSRDLGLTCSYNPTAQVWGIDTKTFTREEMLKIPDGFELITKIDAPVKAKKARTLKDIINHPMVESTHLEWDGCFTDARGREVQGRWVYLKDDFISPDMECATIHEATVKECCDVLNGCVARSEMREFIVVLKSGAEITVSAYTHEGAVQEVKERGYRPSHAELA